MGSYLLKAILLSKGPQELNPAEIDTIMSILEDGRGSMPFIQCAYRSARYAMMVETETLSDGGSKMTFEWILVSLLSICGVGVGIWCCVALSQPGTKVQRNQGHRG